MRITDFARRLGVSVDTVRRLERRRVLAPMRDWAGHRRYSLADLERAQLHLFPNQSDRQKAK
jgi:DNA-binding transcriptional MerR regulator